MAQAAQRQLRLGRKLQSDLTLHGHIRSIHLADLVKDRSQLFSVQLVLRANA